MTIKEIEIQLALGSLSIKDKIKLADNPSAPVGILKKLSTDKDIIVRYHVANNPGAPKEVLKILSKDKYWYVRYWVVRNPNTPMDILKKLSTDENKNVRNQQEVRVNRRYAHT